MKDYKRLIEKALENYSDLFTVEEMGHKEFNVLYKNKVHLKITYNYDAGFWLVKTTESASMEMIGEIHYYLESHLEDD